MPRAFGARVLFPCADRARDALPVGLRARGARVECVVAYRTVSSDDALDDVARRAADGAVDAVLLASPSSARALARSLGRAGAPAPRVACIGPATAAACRDAGLAVDAVAASPSDDGLAAAAVQCLTPSPRGQRGGRGVEDERRRSPVWTSRSLAALGTTYHEQDPMTLSYTPDAGPAHDARDASRPDPRSAIGRLRRNAAARRMLAETVLRAEHLILPLFVRDGRDDVRPIASLPGHAQWTVDRLGAEIDAVVAAGIPAVLLFGVPDEKDAGGTGAWDAEGPVPRAARMIKERAPGVLVIADVCLCEYTSHGHCGALDAAGTCVDSHATLPLLARAAVAYADAGVDVVAPSAMMDGQVAAIRRALDAAGHQDVPIMSYSTKFASAFYGPFRDAVGSAPAFGDRAGHQLPPGNAREAVRESVRDAAEGADLLMVKPAGAYLDVIHRVRRRSSLPLAAYQVSGEYAMLEAAAERGWLDRRRAALESLVAIRRAGADLVITYYAKDAARWLRESDATA
jgi:porphobilinogen synthase